MYRLGFHFGNNDDSDFFKVVGHFLLRALLDSERRSIPKLELCKQIKKLLKIAATLMFNKITDSFLKYVSKSIVPKNVYIDEELDVFKRTMNGRLWENGELLIIIINPTSPEVGIY